MRYLGEFENTAPATRKLVSRLTEKYDHLHFCYEAGPTGYGLYRQLQDQGLCGGGALVGPVTT